ncbi:hypothetical protein OH76DRAFT_195335 [Lentinus brumalis]|uniref:F-box domain-containing protein n=1 Tax=Lentinus brumalis TaxID=2498619 RepID=A0A371DI18_9APHY|nr:hypothetical protein OH76DRAFT_195335 [Polyporus brumalis]
MPTFPTELFEEIIAWIPAVCGWDLRVRYPTLLSCSLVCSAWLPASRHQLFQALDIDTPERYDLLVSRVLHWEKMRVNLLSVRTVVLSPSSDTPVWRPFVLEFAGHLPNVTDMYLYSRSVEAFLLHRSSVVVISRFASVQSLSISHCDFPSFGALRRTLTSLPSLNNLRLESSSWPDPAADLSTSLSHGASTVRRPALLWLTVWWDAEPPHRGRAQQFMAWLSETATSSSLLDLDLGFIHRTLDDQTGYIATFGPSLLRFGRGLRKLKIVIGESYDPELEMFFCTLESLNVFSLHFRAIQPDSWVQLERLVHSLPCPKQLVELKIDVGFSSGPLELSEFDGLEALDLALPLELFKDLQAMQFHVEYIKEEGDPEEGPDVTEPMLAVIKSKLPKLFARNIINVSASAYKVSAGTEMRPITN